MSYPRKEPQSFIKAGRDIELPPRLGLGIVLHMNTILFFLLAAAFLQPPQTQAFPAPSQADEELTWVSCSVRTKQGEIARGLGADDFEIQVQGKRQEVVSVVEDKGDPSEPLMITLLVDNSGSVRAMEGLFQAESAEALEFLRRTLRPQDRVAVVSYNDEVNLVQDFTGDLLSVERAFASMRLGGGTKLFDAIAVSAEELLSKRAGRRLIVVLSDGSDSTSTYKTADAVLTAQRNGVLVFGPIIPFVDPESGSRDLRPQLLEIAEKTGGFAEKSRLDADALRQALSRIREEILHRYRLGYRASANVESGRLHKIRIKAKGKGLKLHCPSGYFVN